MTLFTGLGTDNGIHPLKMTTSYLATPYTKYPFGHEQAYKDACMAAAAITSYGVRVYCPIVHWHPIAKLMPPQPVRFWLNLQKPFMAMAHDLIVVQMPGWEESDGMAFERQYFTNAGKPIAYMPWPLYSDERRSERYCIGC